ncbi:MAG: hypothetical protein JXA37_02275 [Chloroflexia bacterium]|nr:hypothetical protein [Chloroflexia bacterium]
MEQEQERWRRTGIRLAILALVVAGIYFLSIFVKQSLNLYQLSQEIREQEGRVAELERENQRLEKQLARYLGEEGRRMLVKENLPYRDPEERVVIPLQPEEGTAVVSAPPAVEAPSAEDLAALPVWEQWWRVIFAPTP